MTTLPASELVAQLRFYQGVPRLSLSCRQTCKEAAAYIEQLEAKYGELILAVSRKFGGETRHETALRFIQEREENRLNWGCFECMAERALQTHWLTDLGCVHHDDGTGDNAASCWCGWSGPRVASVGEAVRTWSEHAAEALAVAMRAATTAANGDLPVPNRTAKRGPTGIARKVGK